MTSELLKRYDTLTSQADGADSDEHIDAVCFIERELLRIYFISKRMPETAISKLVWFEWSDSEVIEMINELRTEVPV